MMLILPGKTWQSTNCSKCVRGAECRITLGFAILLVFRALFFKVVRNHLHGNLQRRHVGNLRE